MTTPVQVIQSLELTRSLLGSMTKTADEADMEKMYTEAYKILEALRALTEPPKVSTVHPVDVLLKKGKVTLSEGRYKQLVTIYNALILMGGVTFLRAKQNNHTTWFPIDWNGNKTAALFLGAEWTIEPLSVKANGELKGDWENFDLNEFMTDFDFDQDEY